MTPEDFVVAVKEECLDRSVEGCIALFEDPPGRRPSEELKRLSKWFKALSVTDRELVIAAMREAADATLFGLLCVIDGVRVLAPEAEKSTYKLTATREGVESTISPSETFLHDLLRAEP